MGAASLGAACGAAPADPPVDAQAETGRPRPYDHLFDLTHVLTMSMPVYPGLTRPQMTQTSSLEENGVYNNDLMFGEHTGTHLDAPLHFAEGGMTTDQIPAENFFAPLVVISIASRAADDPDTGVTVDDVLAWETAHGPLPPGAFVAMLSGWGDRIGDPDAFANLDDDGVMHAPGYTGEAAAFLCEERDIVGVGVDGFSLDLGTAQEYPAHRTFLPAGKYGVELMANLETVPPAGATLIVGAPKHERGSGGPARVFAVV
jgi:kynurenine formamidase|tara:strand:+ start:2930 stop:3706 length:777 start_codon:yes stop_codon:yes gene_type:complete